MSRVHGVETRYMYLNIHVHTGLTITFCNRIFSAFKNIEFVNTNSALSRHSVSTNNSVLAACYFTHNLSTACSRMVFGCVVNAFSGDVVHTELCKPLDHWQTWCTLLQIVRIACCFHIHCSVIPNIVHDCLMQSYIYVRTKFEYVRINRSMC